MTQLELDKKEIKERKKLEIAIAKSSGWYSPNQPRRQKLKKPKKANI